MKALVKERGIKKTKGDIVFGILNYAVFGLFLPFLLFNH